MCTTPAANFDDVKGEEQQIEQSHKRHHEPASASQGSKFAVSANLISQFVAVHPVAQ